jgi:hypothetical protein
MVVSVSEVGRAGGESRRGEGPTQAKRGEEVGEGGGGVVRSCGGGREEEEEDGAPETSFKNKVKKRVLFDASLCRQWQRNRSEEGSRVRPVQTCSSVSGGGDGESCNANAVENLSRAR